MDMNTEQLEGRYQTVCAAPSGNGFRIGHMPDFLMRSDINDCAGSVHGWDW